MIYHSPITYTGNKSRIFLDIWKSAGYHKYDTFVDVFTGSMAVGINMIEKAQKIICNDKQKPLLMLYRHLTEIGSEELDGFIESKSNQLQEMGKRKWFSAIKEEYNSNPQGNVLNILFLAHCCYNGIVEFNEMNFKGHFGDKGFAKAFVRTIKAFHGVLRKNQNKLSFMSQDFRNIDYQSFGENDLLYFDPPYLVTNTFYNNGWTRNEDVALYAILDELSERKVNWMLSNAIRKGSRINYTLKNWIQNNRYGISQPQITYNMSSEEVEEILIFSKPKLFSCTQNVTHG